MSVSIHWNVIYANIFPFLEFFKFLKKISLNTHTKFLKKGNTVIISASRGKKKEVKKVNAM